MHLPESIAGKRRGEKGIGKEISNIECRMWDFGFQFRFRFPQR